MSLREKRPITAASQRERVWLLSFIVLPYASYAGLLIMLGLLSAAMRERGGQVWALCGRRGFGWLTAGLLLSASFALDRGDGFLQLANFLPFFWFFGVLATVPGVVQQPFIKLESLARSLLLTSLPMTIWAVVEFGLKFDAIASTVQSTLQSTDHSSALSSWLINQIYEPDFGHRARSVFGHPNDLSAYLVILLGLGLGVVIKSLTDKKLWHYERTKAVLQIVALGFVAAAIFCTGSRNGVLIALFLGAITLYNTRQHKWVMLTGLASSGAIVAAVLSFGIGGRSLSWSLVTQDPRVGIWQLAAEMIKQRPWLGWGFSGLRRLYEPGSIPDYDVVFHAHNIWLFLASEAGIPVMIGFCIVVGSIYYRGVRAFIERSNPNGDAEQRQGERAILLGYLLAFGSCLLFGLFDVTLFDARNNVLSWGLLASIYQLSWPHKNQTGLPLER